MSLLNEEITMLRQAEDLIFKVEKLQNGNAWPYSKEVRELKASLKHLRKAMAEIYN